MFYVIRCVARIHLNHNFAGDGGGVQTQKKANVKIVSRQCVLVTLKQFLF